METLETEVYGLANLPSISQKIIRFGSDCKIWLFEGEMGSGKTTLIKQICKEFGVQDKVSSPTYSLINEYRDADNHPLFHFDFYRIKHESEALDIGVDEYFYSGSLCLVEWPSQIPSIIPKQHLIVDIKIINDNKRKVFLKKFILNG